MEINWLFVVVVAIFMICIISGYKKGFLRMIISFIGMIVITIAAIVLTPKLSNYLINNTNLYDSTVNKVINVFETQLEDNSEENDKRVESSLDSLNIPSILKNDFIEKNASEMYEKLLSILFKEYIAGYLATIIIKAGSFVAVFIALSIAVYIISKSVDLISKIPIIRGVNKLCGAILGCAKALIIVWIVFFVVIMFLGENIGSSLLESVESSKFLTFLFNNNYLFKFIS